MTTLNVCHFIFTQLYLERAEILFIVLIYKPLFIENTLLTTLILALNVLFLLLSIDNEFGIW
jgi:hypothetical protein